ncbi:MAG: M23 family metallopeptidase [Ilumatobacter sp.]
MSRRNRIPRALTCIAASAALWSFGISMPSAHAANDTPRTFGELFATVSPPPDHLVLPVAATASSRRAADAPLLDACPVDGSSTFEDSFGWARSGGRSHQGVDLIAARGTPVVAVRDGFANLKTSRLGGRAAWLTTPEGDEFYYAHLDDWNGESRDVMAGELIGWVGSTGNARGAHLHFEAHPGGDLVNPYPATHLVCVAIPAAIVDAERAANAIPAGAISDPDVWARFIPDQS